MSEERDTGGRFRSGAPSPNPVGRPKGRGSRIETLQDLDELTLKVANRRVPVKMSDGTIVMMSLIEKNLLNLGSSNPSNRLAAQSFVQTTRGAMSDLDRLERIGKRRSQKVRSDG